MTVIRGEVWPDHEFPQETFGYHADRNSVHDFGTNLHGRAAVERSIEHLKQDPQTFRLRIARYRLIEVQEIEVVGERPKVVSVERAIDRDFARSLNRPKP